MSCILSFNVSTSDKENLKNIDGPFQIMPGGRATLSYKMIDQFPVMTNDRILIHANYLTRPFTFEPSFLTKTNLSNYAILAKKLGTKNILIHMPSNVKEYENYNIGLQLIIEKIIKEGCLCHLEVNPISIELRKYLDMKSDDASNLREKYYEYIDWILAGIPIRYKDKFRIVIDTAHMFSNGFNGLDMIAFIKKYLQYVDFIHFNGTKAIFANTKDLHIPMYLPMNKIENVDELVTYISQTGKILIAEDSTEKGTYVDWCKFCKKYGIKIVKENEMMSI